MGAEASRAPSLGGGGNRALIPLRFHFQMEWKTLRPLLMTTSLFSCSFSTSTFESFMFWIVVVWMQISPVSGTIIRDASEMEAEAAAGNGMVVRPGDIDPAFNIVDVTDEARAELVNTHTHTHTHTSLTFE